MKEGELKGETQILFGSEPTYSIETRTYCTVGTISQKDFLDICNSCPVLKQTMIDDIMSNPFDTEREWFVEVCQDSIDYFRYIDDDVLRELYYSAKHRYCESGQTLFKVGDRCTEIIVVVSGAIDIVITDGETALTLDLLGRGSVVGSNYILSHDKWYYEAANKSTMAARTIILGSELLKSLKERH